MSTNQELNNRVILNIILWAIIIPQVFLVALNIHGWALISGEANDIEAKYALTTLLFELVLISASTVIFWRCLTKKSQIGWKIAFGSLFVHAVYMLFFLFNINNIIPDSIQPWVLNEENIGRWNITLFMPGAFISLYALTKLFFSSIGEGKGRLIILLTTIGMPLTWYLFVSLMQPSWFGQISVIVSIVIGCLIVVAFLAGIIRFFDNIIHKPATSNIIEKHYIIALLVGLVAPLGGLALNQKIPFPVDFQSFGVYAFTVVNGLVLCIKPEGQTYTSVRLFLRCIVFPFTLYFFLVFLPFLPLSLIAIIAVGAGFLMLTPLALGLFQVKITIDEFNLTRVKVGSSKAILISVLGLSILPSYFITHAIMDKLALETSLEYFYSHDTSAEFLSESQISRSANALVQLRDRKAGIQLPYISSIYNSLVFGDLVLSDKKISRMYGLLTDEALPEQKTSMNRATGSSRRSFRQLGIVAPRQDIDISNVGLNNLTEGQATVQLTLTNTSDDTHSLFVGQLDIPEGVFISGLRLKIENEWVSGRVFDKKTALWVFEKITEVRRDPALLYYLSSKKVELRVYPFPSNGIREVEIDFQYHPTLDSKITIENKEIDLNPTFNSPSIISESGAALVSDNISEIAFQREPYLHFILDYSANTIVTDSEYAERINAVRKELNINEFTVSAANISVSKKVDDKLLGTTDVKEITQFINAIEFRKTGGLWVQQALAKEILHINETINNDSFQRTPIFVLLSDQENDFDVELDPWNWLIPDMTTWYSYSNGNLQSHALNVERETTQNLNSTINPVVAIQQGSKISILPTNSSSILDTSNGEELSIYNPSSDSFNPALPTNQPIFNSIWTDYADIWINWRKVNLNPSELELQRKTFLEKSREKNLLLPTTSLIAVERPSQWEILKRKEKQSINNHSGLDFEDEQQTSEPSWWILLIGLLIFLYLKEKGGNVLTNRKP